MRIKQRLSILAPYARRRHEFPKYTHSPICKVAEAPREPNWSVVSWKMSAVEPRAAAWLGGDGAAGSFCAGGAREHPGMLGLW
jgi:hypothetical protein